MRISCARPRLCRGLFLPALVLVVACGFAPSSAGGIEMFTYFGDGSRIGLPSLEVPVEAYPGIPLRSDRLRARRRAAQMGPGGTVRLGPPGLPTRPGGMMIRAMPPTQAMPRPSAPMPEAVPLPESVP